MIIDANTVPKHSTLSGDICIIGAGAAGITMARSFAKGLRKVILLESGKLEPDTSSTTVETLENTGLPISERSRVQSFGGTTKVWYGRWKPFEDGDLKKRDWIPYSGWPLSYEELSPHYEKALKQVGTLRPSHTYAGSHLLETNELTRINIPILKKSDLDFGKKWKDVFEKSTEIETYLGAHVVSLNHNSSVVFSASVKTVSQNIFTVEADTFILASGGIENPRLLLLSHIGNDHDQVGRYYMDHPKGKVGKVKLFDTRKSYEEMSFALTEHAQRKYGTLNSYVTLEPYYKRTRLIKRFPPILQIPIHKFLKLCFGKPRQADYLAIRNYMEQMPNPENRITLGEKTDMFGNRLPNIHWGISELDKKTMVVFHHILANQIAHSGYGTLESPLLNGDASPWPIHEDASHHMGTTRMGADPKTSVVDRNCKIHSIDNLYIAGSSVFPTSGYANPTATIIALAIRLADHLLARN